MTAPDVNLHAKLDKIIAWTEWQEKETDNLRSAVLECAQAVAGLADPLNAMRLAIEELADAASSDSGDGDSLYAVLGQILDELRDQTGRMEEISRGVRGLRDLTS